MGDKDISGESATSFSGRLVLWIGAVALTLLAALAFVGWRAVSRDLRADADDRVRESARRTGLVVERLAAERVSQTKLLAATPVIVDAAREGTARARALGLPGTPDSALEARFALARSLDASPRARRFLHDRQQAMDMAEVLVTDAHGLNAVTTQETSDFVQRDEAWWEQAWRSGATPAVASFDSSARRWTVSVSSAVRERDGDPPAGVMKVVYGLDVLQEAVALGELGSRIRVDVVDEQGRIIVSSSGEGAGTIFPGFRTVSAATAGQALTYEEAAGPERAAVAITNQGTWRVVAHLPESVALQPLNRARLTLLSATLALGALVLAALAGARAWLTGRISRPAEELAAISESVAGGDLSVRFTPSRSDDEVGRLSRAVSGMVAGLRDLAGALSSSVGETASLAAEITAGTENMSAAAQEMARTSSELSQQAANMAETIQAMAGDASRLAGVAGELAGGAHEGVDRNTQLRALAGENRERLDASARALEGLAEDIRASARDVEALAQASAEIQAFVTLVQKVARQSKMLALNAAMEAARAGEHGEGFAVVATEVRRLATSAAEGAERTELLVQGVLRRIEQSRASAARTVATVDEALVATQQGQASFAEVERAVESSEAWTASIDGAASTTNELVAEITRRLDEMARGTESFAAAMEQVAASSEEQSASTEQIAGAASTLATAADRLQRLVGDLRYGDTAQYTAQFASMPAGD